MFCEGLLQIVPSVDAGTEDTAEKSCYKCGWFGPNAYGNATPELAGHLLLKRNANYCGL